MKKIPPSLQDIHPHPAWHRLKPSIHDRMFLGALLDETARLQRIIITRRMKEYGATYTQWHALSNISRRDGMTQTQICHLLEITKGACTTLINRLIKAGLVERQTSENDRREQIVFVTHKGKALMEKEVDMLADLYTETFGDISDESLRQFRDTMLSVYKNWSVVLQRDDD
jgi:DNA-binding MarR family transcriptional regulator